MQIKIRLGEANKTHDNKINPAQPANEKKNTPAVNCLKTAADGAGEILEEINSMIGLAEVKSVIMEVRAFAEIQKQRTSQQLLSENTVLHSVFKGNPGTGKTTMARLLARLYKEMGILQKGHLIEVERADLVGEYIGHTAQKTKEQVKKALGGILFIDEAYSLARGGEKDFGREAIDVLVKAMEDYKNDFILILAGYRQEMNDFMTSNSGLESRFPLHIDFPDYSSDELLEITMLMYGKRQYSTTNDACALLKKNLGYITVNYAGAHGNARTVRNLVESSLRMQALRLVNSFSEVQISSEDLQTINSFDIQKAFSKLKLPTMNTPAPHYIDFAANNQK